MIQPFKHNLTKDNLGEIFGWVAALTAVMNYIHLETEGKPENRKIDAVPLLEKIGATADTFSKLLAEKQTELKAEL